MMAFLCKTCPRALYNSVEMESESSTWLFEKNSIAFWSSTSIGEYARKQLITTWDIKQCPLVDKGRPIEGVVEVLCPFFQYCIYVSQVEGSVRALREDFVGKDGKKIRM